MIKYGNIALTIITIHRAQCPLCLLLLVRLGGYIVNSLAFSATLKAKVVSTLAKAAALRVNLNVDGVSITSKTHTRPSHSQTSRLLTSSLSLGVPVPRATQCIRGV